MKNLKKDNKGFSLVELIVVVLIMAIIAVALAPQIIKWVNNSRISADNDTMQSIIAAAQTAVTNEKVYAAINGKNDVTITVTNVSGSTSNISDSNTYSGTDTFTTKFYEYAGISAVTDFKVKQSNSSIVVTVSKDKCKVTGQFTGDAATASIDN